MGFIQNAQYKKVGIVIESWAPGVSTSIEKANPVFTRYEPSKRVLQIRPTQSALMIIWNSYVPSIRSSVWFLSIADIADGEAEYEIVVGRSAFSMDGTGLPFEDIMELLLNYFDALDPEHSHSRVRGITRTRYSFDGQADVKGSSIGVLYDGVSDFFRDTPPQPKLIEFARHQQTRIAGLLIREGR